MKMTITIHGINEDYAADIERDIENACAYYCGGNGEIQPTCFVETMDEDEADYKVEKCCMCHCEYYACELDEDGMCEECAEEIREGKAN